MLIRYPTFDLMQRKVVLAEGLVVDEEVLQTALGERLTWKIQTRDGKGWHWVNASPPYVYRRLFEINPELSLLWEVTDE